jgi:hypothetical protein
MTFCDREALASASLDGETHVIEPLPRLAISVHAPWAWALLYGGKDIENRAPNFPMRHRGAPVLGDVWLHASLWPGRGPLRDFSDAKAAFVAEGQRMVETMWESQGWLDETYDIRNTKCLARLYALTEEKLGVSVPKTSELNNLRGHIVGRLRVTGHRDPRDPPESAWYVLGSKAVLVEAPRPLATPVLCKGALGWWPVPDDVIEQLRVAA